MRTTTLLIAAAVLIAAALPTTAGEGQLNVQVEDDDGATVRISVSLSSIGSAAAFIPTRLRARGDIEIDGERWTAADLRRAWNDLRHGDGAAYVRVTDEDARIRLSKRGSLLRVTIDEVDGGRVELRLPTRAVDALLGGDGDELEIAAAVRVMAEMGEGELVAISDGAERLRVWVGEDD